MSSDAILLLGLLMAKHFVCDFLLQTPWQISQKGRYGELGGILHSGIHVVGTGLVLLVLRPELPVVLTIMALEFVVHYHIDWTKEQIVRRMRWQGGKSFFWWAIGFDQLLHNLTYLAMAAYLLG